MGTKFTSLPRKKVIVDTLSKEGSFDWWRHTIGHGGINHLPLPDRVVDGASKLKPRLVRTFIQEYFNFYPEHGVFDWSKLDPYMDSLARTGGKVVAAICIKPKVLFPEIDQSIYMPNDVEEWQRVIYELVKRYSVDKEIVTYWEIGNETDIGEHGGCPYLITDPKAYFEYYKMTIKPILEAFPQAKVGGPAIASARHKLMAGFINCCLEAGTQLDFVSWHLYSDDAKTHVDLVKMIMGHLKGFSGKRPEMLVTEFNKSFDPVSVEDMAFEPYRAAVVANNILALMDAGLDWSFYYHVWDQTFYYDDFALFYSDPYIMDRHWNEIPHRFGMFGVNEEVRPQYFAYRMLGEMGDERVSAKSDDEDLAVRGVCGEGKASAFIVNYNPQQARDLVVSVYFEGLKPGPKTLKVYRIDEDQRWSLQEMELIPVEERVIDTAGNFNCQIYSSAYSVSLVTLEDK